MPLIKHGRIVADPFVAVGLDDPLPATGPVLMPLARWQRDRDALAGETRPLGVRLESHEPAAALQDDVGRLALIALVFPTFRDGRAYSTARLLRERYGYTGELRAVGNVLRDQYLFMDRCGIDALEVRDAEAAKAWDEALGEFSVFYQPAGDRRASAPALRRRAAGVAE